MYRGAYWSALAVVSGPAGAQNMTPFVPPSRPPVQPARDLPVAELGEGRIPERRGSPIETLDSLTGEPGPEGGQGREAGSDEIETDRDAFTPATRTVGRGRLIVESAYTFIDNRRVKETHSSPLK